MIDAVNNIRCLVLDVDGVLTDGRLYYSGTAEPERSFHIRDGLAIRWFLELCGPVVFLTAKHSRSVLARATELDVHHVLQGSQDKLADLQKLLDELQLSLDQVAMIGDDLPDLPVLRRCGLSIAPADAAPEVRQVAKLVTRAHGGEGVVREVVEQILRANGSWERVLARYA